MIYGTIPYNVIHHTYSATYAWLKDDVVMAGPHVQLAQEPGPVFHYYTFNGSVKCKSPKKEKKIDVLFQNWKLQNGNIVNPNAQKSGIDALQAIDELIQKEEENLNNFKKRLDRSNEIDDDSQTLLG